MKKILIIASNCLSLTSNNGKTYAALLSRYSKGKLGQIYFTYAEEPNFNLCGKFFRISDVDVINSYYRGFCGLEIRNEYTSSEIQANRGNNLIKIAKKTIPSSIRDLLWYFCKWNDVGLKAWLNEFKPELIFYVGSNQGFSNRIARTLSKEMNIPLVTYYTDDYLINSIPRNIFYPLNKWRRNLIYQKTVKQSSLLYAIGSEMAEIYSEYFKREFKYVMNAVDVLPFSEYKHNHSHRVISYFGGLHLGRWKAIVKLAKCLPLSFSIHVYTLAYIDGEMQNGFDKCPNIKLCGGTKGLEMLEKMRSSDFLLHIESDEKCYRRLTSLSISTKIPEYLMCARPLIAFGPKEVASMKLLSNNEIGFVIDSELNLVDVKKEILKIMEDEKKILDVVKKGYEFAVNNFDQEKISKKIYEELESLA